MTGWPANPKLVRHLKSTLIRTGVHVDEAVMGLSVHTDEDGGGQSERADHEHGGRYLRRAGQCHGRHFAADEGSAFDTSESYSYATYCVTGNHQVDGLRRSQSTAAGRRFSSFLVSETEARSTLVHLLAVEGCLGGGFRHRK